MTRRPISTDASGADHIEAHVEAVTRCFELYGADPARWPASEREAYGAYADASELAAARAEATALDGFLGAATAPHMDQGLPSRMMAGFDAHKARASKGGRFGLEDFLSGLVSPPRFAAGAFAAAAALGVVSGVVSGSGTAVAPEAEAYAYLMDASPFLFDDAEISQ